MSSCYVTVYYGQRNVIRRASPHTTGPEMIAVLVDLTLKTTTLQSLIEHEGHGIIDANYVRSIVESVEVVNGVRVSTMLPETVELTNRLRDKLRSELASLPPTEGIPS